MLNPASSCQEEQQLVFAGPADDMISSPNRARAKNARRFRPASHVSVTSL